MSLPSGRRRTAHRSAGGGPPAPTRRPRALRLPSPQAMRPRLTAEILIVLAIFPLPYVLTALAVLVQSAVHGVPRADSRSRYRPRRLVVSSSTSCWRSSPWLPAALVIYLLSISGKGGGRAIGLDRSHPRQDLALLLPGVRALLPGSRDRRLAVAPRQPRSSYRTSRAEPAGRTSRSSGIATAVSAGVVEEIVVLGFVVRRLEQLGLRPVAVVTVAVLVRISYHLYYGWGVLPILAWAVASVLVYRRYRRLGPFIAVHVALGRWADPRTVLRRRAAGREVLLLAPSTFVFWLMWRDRLPRRPDAPRSGSGVARRVALPGCRASGAGRSRAGESAGSRVLAASSTGLCASRSSRSTAVAASADPRSATLSPSFYVSRRTWDASRKPSAPSVSTSSSSTSPSLSARDCRPSGLPVSISANSPRQPGATSTSRATW